MSDLRTELKNKVIPKMQSLKDLTFDDPEQPKVPVTPPLEKVTNNELIFNWVKDHPACYGKDVARGMAGKVTEKSVLSQLFNLTERKLLHKVTCSTSGLMMYSAAVASYPRSTKANLVAKMHEARAKMPAGEIARRISEGHRRNKLAEADKQLEPVRKIKLVKKTPPKPDVAVQVTPVDLNTLSIVQARKLYDELKQIFGA